MAENVNAAQNELPLNATPPPARPQSIEERIQATLQPVSDSPPLEERAEPETPLESAEPEPAEPEESESAEIEASTEEESATTGTEDEAVEEVALTSLPEVAEHLGVDMSDLYGLSIPITDADGNRRDITLSEFKDSVQNVERAKVMAEEAKTLREQAQKDITEHKESFQAEHTQSAQLLGALEQAVLEPYKNLDWEGLKTADPTSWAVKRAEFQERQEGFNQIRQNAAVAYEQAKQRFTQEEEKTYVERLRKEEEHLFSKLPKWRDESVRATEQESLKNYLIANDYSDAEAAGISDHRLVVLAHKAMMFDQLDKQANVAKKKVLKIGTKNLKPGAKRSKANARQDAEKALKANLRKSGSTQDAEALIRHRLGL